jgi:hypothetical protein
VAGRDEPGPGEDLSARLTHDLHDGRIGLRRDGRDGGVARVLDGARRNGREVGEHLREPEPVQELPDVGQEGRRARHVVVQRSDDRRRVDLARQ